MSRALHSRLGPRNEANDGGPAGANGAGSAGGAGGGSAEEAALGSLIGGGSGDGGGGGGGPSGPLGTFAEMLAVSMTGAVPFLRGTVVPKLLDNAKKYGLDPSEAGANAIYDELGAGDTVDLRSDGTSDNDKLKILRSATLEAIDTTKDETLEKELKKLVADVDKKLKTPDAGPH